MPLCRTPEERLFIQQFILDRIVLSYLYWWPSNEPNSSEKIIAECLERLRSRGKYTPAQERRTAPNPPRVTTRTNQGTRAVPNAEIYLSNPPAVPNGKSYLSKVSNAESYLSTPFSARDLKIQNKQPVASHAGTWGAAQER